MRDDPFEDQWENEVRCGSQCGHFDNLNQCCWLSWWNKQEGDYCNYGLVEIGGIIYTPKELKQLKKTRDKEATVLEG